MPIVIKYILNKFLGTQTRYNISIIMQLKNFNAFKFNKFTF